VRKAVAGILIGLAAAALVLGIDRLLTAIAPGSGLQPLQTVEMRTYDWRLTRTARPQSARPDIALVEIDEASIRSLEPNAGRWPWPRAVHGLLIDYLARAPAKVVVYDVNFAEADSRTGFDFRDSVISGTESDKLFADSLKASGNVITLADATFDGKVSGAATVPDVGYRLQVPGIYERASILAPTAVVAGAVALGAATRNP